MNEDKINLYIHAGMGKTGSTAIQQCLKRNCRELEKQGCLYTGLFFETLDKDAGGKSAHSDYISAIKLPVEERERVLTSKLDEAINYCITHNLNSVLWSNESILDHIDSIGPVLSKYREKTNLKLIIYLRRQDNWYISAYKQWGIKHKTYPGPVIDFEAWFKSQTKRGNYADILEGVEEYVGKENLEVRIYENTKNVVDDLLNVTGLRVLGDDCKNIVYETPSEVILSLFKIYNSQFDKPKLPNDLMALISGAGIEHFKFNPVSPDINMPSTAMLRDLLDSYDEQNELLSAYSKPDYDVKFDKSPIKEPQSAHVDYSQLMAALLMTMISLDEKLQTAYKRINQLERKLNNI